MKKGLHLTTENQLKKITGYAKRAPEGLENLSCSALIRMIRNKLFMTQAQLAKRAGVPQSHIAKIEKGRMNPRVDTLAKILKALWCDMLIVPKPVRGLDVMIRERINRVARKKVEGIAGTMQLEDQSPSEEIVREMIREEEAKLKSRPTSKIWEDEG